MNRSPRRTTLAVAGLVLATSTLTGCGGSGKTDEAATTPTTLTVITPGQPGNLDPALANVTEAELWYASLAYEPLIHLGANGELEPALATSWQYLNDDNTEFELTLRSDAQFSDGTPVDAAAVAASLNYTRQAKGLISIWVSNVTSVTAHGDDVVVIKTSSPNPALPNLLTNALLIGDIINPKALDDPATLGTTPAGAGPYVLDGDETVAGDHYTYVPNEHYYEPDAIAYEKVVVRVVSNPNSALQTLQSGDADLMVGDINTVSGAEAADLNVTSAPVSAVGIDLLDRNGELVPALADQRVRQALNYAVDRTTISEALLKGHGEPTTQIGGPAYPGYLASAEGMYSYDPDKARALLAEAGYPDGFTMNMEILANNTIGEVAQAVIPYWEAVGVKVKADNQTDIATWVTNINSKKFASFGFGYGYLPFYLYASSWYLPVVNPFNAFGTGDDQLTALVEQGNAASGTEQRAIYEQATQRALDLAWAVPVARTSVLYYSNDKVGGISVDAARPYLDLTEVLPASE